jgi:hypothetical protein
VVDRLAALRVAQHEAGVGRVAGRIGADVAQRGEPVDHRVVPLLGTGECRPGGRDPVGRLVPLARLGQAARLREGALGVGDGGPGRGLGAGEVAGAGFGELTEQRRERRRDAARLRLRCRPAGGDAGERRAHLLGGAGRLDGELRGGAGELEGVLRRAHALLEPGARPVHPGSAPLGLSEPLLSPP